MFSLQISQAANRLRDAGLPDGAIDALMDMLGNCQQNLVHRGPITVSAQQPDAVYNPGEPVIVGINNYAPDARNGENYPAAAATFIGDGVVNETTNVVNGGFSAAFHGPVWFNGRFVFPGGAVGIDASVLVLTGFSVGTVNGKDGFIITNSTLTFTKGILTAVTENSDIEIEGEECA